MGEKGEELWDDSVLIKAFDRAISTFKVMHGKEGQKSFSAGGEVTRGDEQTLAGLVSESNLVTRDLEINLNNVSSATKSEETINASLDKGTIAENNGTLYNMNSSNDPNMHNGYSQTESAEDYNHLLSQYYEVEAQRQKILNQLYGAYDSRIEWGTNSASLEHQLPAQASHTNDSIAQTNGTIASQEYQVPALASHTTDSITATQMNGTSASEEHHVLTPQVCGSTVACCCCSCKCPCLVVPCTSLPVCTRSGNCVGKCGHNTIAAGQNANLSSVEKDDLVKTAMGAADRVLSTLQTSVNASISGGHENEGVYVCNKCGWPFPKLHPSAKHRRAHKKICGTIEGYKLSGGPEDHVAHLNVEDDGDEDCKTPNEEAKVEMKVQCTGPKTDLTSVLNAWYSAGFYTCKYLMEQSDSRK